MHRFWREFIEGLDQATGQRNPRHRLTESDVDGFLAAADARPKHINQTPGDIPKMLKLRNPWRWRRMQADWKWAREMLIRSGYDPEEIRWIL